MKRLSILLLSATLLVPTYPTLAETEAVSISANVKQDLVSLDDFILTLDGDIDILEENQIYHYQLNEFIITIDLTEGYSLVNTQSEPYLLVPSELDESVLNIVWFIPKLIEDEIWVPIQFIERIFNTTYQPDNESFLFNEPIEIEEDVQKEVVTAPPTSKPPVINQVIPQEPEKEEDVTNQPVTPQAPITSKPENNSPSTPVTPKPEDTAPSAPPSTEPPVTEQPQDPTPPETEDPEIPDNEEPNLPENKEDVNPEQPEQPENPNPPTEDPVTPTPPEGLPEDNF